jgi:hypothetical protein
VEVVPTNFVLFTSWSIIGSSVLYHDLARTSPIALLGVGFMFLGVYMITSKSEHDYSPGDIDEESALLHHVQDNVSFSPHSICIEAGAVPITISSGTPIIHSNLIGSPSNQGLQSTSLRRVSIDFGFGDDQRPADTARKRLSAVLNSVGTHSVRRMELDHHTLLSKSPQKTAKSPPF